MASLVGPERGRGLRDMPQAHGDRRPEALALGGQSDGPVQPTEQGDAKMILQAADLPADRSLADAEFDRGGGKAEAPRGRLEDHQGIHGGQRQLTD